MFVLLVASSVEAKPQLFGGGMSYGSSSGGYEENESYQQGYGNTYGAPGLGYGSGLGGVGYGYGRPYGGGGFGSSYGSGSSFAAGHQSGASIGFGIGRR